jgi:hypothetical protein
MAGFDFKNWRGYFYISLGLTFGIYRGIKVVEWSTWDFFDQVLAVGMVATGVILLLKNQK